MNNSLCVLDLVIFTKSIGIDACYCQYLWKTSQLIDIYTVELWSRDSNIDILNTTIQAVHLSGT